MLLQPGHWLGRGSILVEGHSLGTTAQCDVQIERDEAGLTLRAGLTLQDAAPHEYVVHVVGNDVGTYTLHVQTGAELLHGTAKLDSAPNLGLLWNDSGSVYATFTLFAIAAGCGLRGFLRDGETIFTWEIAFSLKQDVVQADNVISLRSRPRRR